MTTLLVGATGLDNRNFASEVTIVLAKPHYRELSARKLPLLYTRIWELKHINCFRGGMWQKNLNHAVT